MLLLETVFKYKGYTAWPNENLRLDYKPSWRVLGTKGTTKSILYLRSTYFGPTFSPA